MSPLDQLLLSAWGQGPWVQTGFEPWSGGKHLLPSAKAPVSVDLSYFSNDAGENAGSYSLLSLQTLTCSIGPV